MVAAAAHGSLSSFFSLPAVAMTMAVEMVFWVAMMVVASVAATALASSSSYFFFAAVAEMVTILAAAVAANSFAAQRGTSHRVPLFLYDVTFPCLFLIFTPMLLNK